MNDAERKHRWMTEAELQEMLDKAREEGRDEARAEAAALQSKAIRFDLDRAGIESREKDSVALVEARAEIERLNRAWADMANIANAQAAETDKAWAANDKTVTQRDEARAEVERLRGIAMHPTGVTWARYHETVMEIVREEAALDYKAGAEAMRKAVRRIAVREPGASQRVVELIENLPVPEDTP